MSLWDWIARRTNSEPCRASELLRALPAERHPAIPTHPKGHGFSELQPLGGARYGGFIEPRDFSPEQWHPFLRYLRDRIPDVAAGVWAWVRLCSTRRIEELVGGTELERERARGVLEDLQERLLEGSFDHRPGFEGILEQFFQSAFTVGAYAGELVAREDRSGLARFHPVDPATIRFKRYPSSGRLTPYQLRQDGTLVALHEPSFFYFGLDTDAGNPYGRSPLASLPFVIRLQTQLFEDMGKAAHNAGYPTLHVKYHAPEREPGESLADYQNRVQSDFESISTAMKTRSPESNFLTQHNIEIEYVGPSGQMLRWRETLETISEQVVAALHLAPFLIGRNYGTTQSWARAQYDLMVNNAASVQRAAARMVDWIANLELALSGSPVRMRCRFAPHTSWNDVDEARAQSLRLATLLKLRDNGLIAEDQILARLEE
ncbi:MAG: hypothetical protein HUU16_11780 [Candidatus Omnitrophica bacterium]|nr:hypothetical protein [bacterium]NUN96843.1 hypothetical protein [Candidatus Omnitrophota bacterium]